MTNLSGKQLDELRKLLNAMQAILDATDAALPEIDPEIKKLVEYRLANRICLGCGQVIAKDLVVRMGLDPACYSTTRSRIHRGKTTEREQIQLGKLSPERCHSLGDGIQFRSANGVMFKH